MRTKHHDKNGERANILHGATNALEKWVIYVRRSNSNQFSRAAQVSASSDK